MQVACARDGSKAFPGAADVWEVRGQAEEAAGDIQVLLTPPPRTPLSVFRVGGLGFRFEG